MLRMHFLSSYQLFYSNVVLSRNSKEQVGWSDNSRNLISGGAPSNFGRDTENPDAFAVVLSLARPALE